MKNNTPLPSEITSESLYNRRQFVQKASLALASAGLLSSQPKTALASTKPLVFSKNNQYIASQDDPLTDYDSVVSYNNFYELGSKKTDPHRNAHWLQTDPWSLVVEGEVNKPGKLHLEDIHRLDIEERVYRLRCVETWSMVIPWLGIPLAKLLKRFEPTAKAKFVEFVSIYNPDKLLGQRSSVLDWPYREGLRLDEAKHPLTLISTGLYGKHLLPQNGAPIRLVVPWKYGFKSIKSIVAIRLTEDQPRTAWNVLAPHEYGFYANVNPNVRHPRWSQSRERRIGEISRRKTSLFNGYQEVASLYKDLDLKRFF